MGTWPAQQKGVLALEAATLSCCRKVLCTTFSLSSELQSDVESDISPYKVGEGGAARWGKGLEELGNKERSQSQLMSVNMARHIRAREYLSIEKHLPLDYLPLDVHHEAHEA